MAITETFKVLGQVAPAASTETTVYTVPASTSVVVSSITVCNRGTGAARYRIAIVPGGGATANKDYLAFDTRIVDRATDAHVYGLTLAATDVIKVEADSADLSFAVFGTELT